MAVNHTDAFSKTLTALQAEAEAKRLADAALEVPRIYVGLATCGISSGATDTLRTFKEELARRKLKASVSTLGCIGHCYAEPYVIIDHPDSGFPPIFYPNVTTGKAKMLTGLFIEEGDPRLEHILGAMEPNDLIPSVMDFARFNLEKRVVLEHCGQVDPEDLHDYIVHGGYQGLQKALQTTTADLIRIVTDAKLRGRGGAGFCTGLKWQIVQQAVSSEKVVICNADEGDPGAYMDRTILESCPHQVLEGLAICAHAVGARQAIIYVRAEYPLAVKTLQTAIEQLRQTELVGPGAAFPLYIRIFQGSGAFVCGEETALIQSLEGRRGMARHRPPYPAQEGLAHQPTVINNVKTLASVPAIIKKGSSWFQGIGTSGSPGTAVFSVVGDVVHPGLVEIPMGVTLRTLIYDICGGIPNQKAFKAVQIGGPSGGCLPADLLDTPIDFDSLGEAGAMMGSGGLVVMDEDTCMVNVARYFLDFTQKESCGKCTFCRIGTRQSLNILERITCGKGQTNDLILLQELSEDITAGSLCGLGKTAPNPVLTSLQYFHDEYEAHISEGKCPSKMCRPLTAFYIDLDQCARGCDACVGCCPVDAVFTTPNRKKGIDQSLCVKCGECMVACPPDYDAVRKVSPPHLAPIIERPVKPIKDE